MKKPLALVIVSLAACAPTAVTTAPVEAPVARIPQQPEEVAPPPDAPREAPSEVKGTTLMSEQFSLLVKDKLLTDKAIPYDERVKRMEAALGVKGVPADERFFTGTAWFGLSLRSIVSPISCTKLIVTSSGTTTWTMMQASHADCGLPFAADPKKMYSGPSPKRTVTRLETALGDVGTLSPLSAEQKARSLLGNADYSVNGEDVWAGLGPKGKEAPFTCKGLFVGGRARIEDVPLDKCSLQWPMPGTSYDPGPPIPLADKSVSVSECATKCGAKEMCLVDQRSPYTASTTMYPGGMRATYPDGKAAPMSFTSMCVPIPPTCTTVNDACFFGPPNSPTANGPCPKDDFSGHALLTTPSTHIVCYSRVGKPPLVPPPPPPPLNAPHVVSPLLRNVF